MDSAVTKKLLLAQVAILFVGTALAWSALAKIQNPLATPCFYGSMAFLVALLWSVRIYQVPSARGERWLRNFLLFCVIFAASVVTYEACSYYKFFGIGSTTFICTPGVPPTQTPCFTGMLFFIAAFIVALVATRQAEPPQQV